MGQWSLLFHKQTHQHSFPFQYVLWQLTLLVTWRFVWIFYFFRSALILTMDLWCYLNDGSNWFSWNWHLFWLGSPTWCLYYRSFNSFTITRWPQCWLIFIVGIPCLKIDLMGGNSLIWHVPFFSLLYFCLQVMNIIPLKGGNPPKYSQRTQLITENYQVVWFIFIFTLSFDDSFAFTIVYLLLKGFSLLSFIICYYSWL